MPRTIFAKVGTNEQTIDLRDNPVSPVGFIEMQFERPLEGDWTAQADGTWLEKVISLDDAKAAKLKEINDWADAQIATITGKYPQHEVVTWDKQEEEAKKYKSDKYSHTPFIDSLCNGRGVMKAALCDKVVEKAEAFTAFTGNVIGQRQALEDQLEAASTVAEVEAVELPQ